MNLEQARKILDRFGIRVQTSTEAAEMLKFARLEDYPHLKDALTKLAMSKYTMYE